jgi:hypothetical protein
MTRVVLHEPAVAAHAAVFRWEVEPASDLYRAQEFHLRFPDTLPIGDVPAALWRTVVLLCLHSHWTLLRPCRVELPWRLAPGEREFWLRLCDAAVATLEVTRGGRDVARAIELWDDGPRDAPPVAPHDAGRTVTAFSGGKDSLLQLGLLAELGQEPIAVMTTSPMPPMYDHLTPRRRALMAEIVRRRRLELVEVHSDLRSAWHNDFARLRGHQVAVNEISDTFLYLASALVVGWLRGAPRVFLASEAELQETVLRDGLVVQHPHFMYSAVTQRALDALLSRHGLRYGSTNYPLRSGQVQRLLWTRYHDLRDLQYSCWRVGPDEAACSACAQCLRVALTALSTGGDPAVMGIDLVRLLPAMRDWAPAEPSGEDLPDDRVKASLHGHVVRELRAVSPLLVARRLAAGSPRRLLDRRVATALRCYAALRRRVGAGGAAVPAPGYRRAYLALVDERLRDRLAAIYDGVFEPADAEDDAAALARTRRLADWIAAPLMEAT